MSSYNILLTCAGGPAAIGVIKSLKLSKHQTKVVAVDSDCYATGFYLADTSYVVPQANSLNYWQTIIDIIKKEKINLLIPTGDSDVVFFAKNKKQLEKLGVCVFNCELSAIETMQDKLQFWNECKGLGVLPITSTTAHSIGFPLFAKPKRGSGSRGVKVCYNINDTQNLTEDYIYQEYLPGEEYTVDVLCNFQSEVVAVVPRKRLQIKAGISTKNQIVNSPEIENICKALVKHLYIVGPVCIQLKQDLAGEYKVIEINPRVGGGTHISTLAGVNIPELMIQICDKVQLSNTSPAPITVVRYYEEIIIPNGNIL